MDPFFFGSSSAPLYGVYHKPKTLSYQNEGVLLLPPFGQEYMRGHRALRQLAMMLSAQGVPVLRFDYRGTGDSSGSQEEVTPTDWIADAQMAIDELKETTELKKISLVAPRISGLIAYAAARSRTDIESIILWDGAVSGELYLGELKEQILASPHLAPSNFIDDDGTLHYNGFSLSAEFQRQLNELDLTGQQPLENVNTIYIVSEESESSELLRKQWHGNRRFEYEYIKTETDWNHVDNNGSILLPQMVIQSIVNRYKNKEAA